MRPAVILTVAASLLAGCINPPPVPPEQELKALVRDSLLAFHKAIQVRDFKGFQLEISSAWRKQITAEELEKVFQSFVDQQIDLSGVANTDPVFSEASSVSKTGVLLTQGMYPTSPTRIDFRLQYVQEEGAWKLFAIKIEAKPAQPAAALSDPVSDAPAPPPTRPPRA